MRAWSVSWVRSAAEVGRRAGIEGEGEGRKEDGEGSVPASRARTARLRSCEDKSGRRGQAWTQK